MEELITGLPEVLAEGGTARCWATGRSTAARRKPAVGPSARAAGPGPPVCTPGSSSGTSRTPPAMPRPGCGDASEERDLADYRRRYADYLQDFEDRGVAGVGFGMIWLQRPASGTEGRPWRRFEELTGEVQQPLGPVIGRTAERALAAQTDPEAVLGQVLAVPEDVTEERYQRFGRSIRRSSSPARRRIPPCPPGQQRGGRAAGCLRRRVHRGSAHHRRRLPHRCRGEPSPRRGPRPLHGRLPHPPLTPGPILHRLARLGGVQPF